MNEIDAKNSFFAMLDLDHRHRRRRQRRWWFQMQIDWQVQVKEGKKNKDTYIQIYFWLLNINERERTHTHNNWLMDSFEKWNAFYNNVLAWIRIFVFILCSYRRMFCHWCVWFEWRRQQRQWSRSLVHINTWMPTHPPFILFLYKLCTHTHTHICSARVYLIPSSAISSSLYHNIHTLALSCIDINRLPQ